MMRPSDANGERFRSAFPLVAILGVGLMLMGCLPTAGPAASSGAAPANAPGPKILRMGMIVDEEPKAGIIAFGTAGSTGDTEYMYIFHAALTIYDAGGTLLPQLAQKVPTVADGDWRLLPDGQMEVTWKLRPNLKWHDGAPATAEDFAFGMRVVQDRDFPHRPSDTGRLISEITAPDASTLVARWKQAYVFANASGPTDLPALPRHLLGDLYESGDKQGFFNSLFWTHQFVGLGPYRFIEYVEGSRLEGVAFDDYALGRPRIDRVVFQFFGDNRGLLVSLLSDAMDVAPYGSLSIPQILEIRRAWDTAGTGTTFMTFSGSRDYSFQFRNPDAPWARDVRVRRALTHMLDRQALADALMGGLVSVADTPASPGDPVYRLLEQRGLPRYPFDQSQAERLMAEAGWTRPPGGTYQSSTGQPFTIDLTFGDAPENVAEAQAVAGQWKAAGVADPTLSGIPETAPSDVRNERRNTFTGVFGFPTRPALLALNKYTTAQIGTASNRWTGSNRQGYSNPEFDRLYDRALVTLDEGQRHGLMADFLKLLSDDIAMISIYYDPGQATGVVRKGVRGPGPTSPLQQVTTWNIHEWDMD